MTTGKAETTIAKCDFFLVHSSSGDTKQEWKQNKKAVGEVGGREKRLELLKDARKRFVLELEFVEMLSNPFYLQYLAQNRFFEDRRFLNYLKYLLYWTKPEYIKHISFPHCLYFLELLQREEFRKKLVDRAYINLVHEQQFYHWRFHKHHRCVERKREAEIERLAAENKEAKCDQV
uniref:Mediator of RNA polymerase II transcription subunit 31 n=1 Tax=Lotharella globosa TaxID=91324 RepID=A0A7S3Z8J0_9EUKA